MCGGCEVLCGGFVEEDLVGLEECDEVVVDVDGYGGIVEVGEIFECFWFYVGLFFDFMLEL